MPNNHAGVRRADLRSRPGTVPAASAEAQAHGGLITALLDSLQVGVVTLDNDGRPVLFNRTLRHLYGLGDDLSTAEAMRSAYGTLHHPDGIPPRDDVVIARALHGETVRDAEAVLHAADRPDRYLLSNAQPILDADGRQLGAVSTVLDVTNASAVSACGTANSRSPAC